VTEDKEWRKKKNAEHQKDVNTGTFTKLQSLRWMGHLERMDDATNTKKKYQPNLYQKRPKSSPKARWKDDVGNDIKRWE
jgi:hypothetical protein